MNTGEIVDKVRAALHARADVNGDGKVTRADIERVAQTVAMQADAQVHAYPWAGVVIALICGACLGYALRALGA